MGGTIGRITFGPATGSECPGAPQPQTVPRVWGDGGKLMAQFPRGVPFEVREPTARPPPAPERWRDAGGAPEGDYVTAGGEGERPVTCAVYNEGDRFGGLWADGEKLSPETRIFGPVPKDGGGQPPKPRPAPTLAQLRAVEEMASDATKKCPDEVEALAAFRAYILGDDPEAGQNLAEIHPALVNIGELALGATAAVEAHDSTFDSAVAGAAFKYDKLSQKRRAALKELHAAAAEYRRYFPDPAVLPDLPEG